MHAGHQPRQWRGKIDIRILRDGRWLYRGTPIERESMVRLFASQLRREGDEFLLDTPDQVLRIEVEDVPFVVDTLEPGSSCLFAVTNVGDRIPLDGCATLEWRAGADESRIPYLEVRPALWARFSRSAYYQLATLAECRTDGAAGVEEWGVPSGQYWIPLPL